MSRPPSPAVTIAIADIRAGMTWKAAAAKHGISESTISRAIKREASRCPTCGQVVKESKHVES